MSIGQKLGLAIALAICGHVTSIATVTAAPLPAIESVNGDAGHSLQVRYRGGGRYYGGGYGYYGGYYAPPVYLYAGPPVVYSYRATGSSYCANLRQKARATGSRYWWNRYRNEC